MELQWPLMIFTLFICLGAGTFGVAGLLAALKKAPGIQLPATLVALVAIVIGGIASFLHLQHWDRLFNGFGHLTSGITQELIGIVVFVAAAVVYLVLARRGELPVWAGALALVVSVALVVVMANSYTMEARPVWDTPLLWLYYLANAVLSGALVCAALAGVRRPTDAGSAAGSAGVRLVLTVALAGTALTLIALVAYAVFIPAQAAAFTSVGNYFDPTHPTKVMADPQGALAGFLTGDQAGLFWAGALVIGALVPGALAFLARKREGATLAAMAAVGVLCALAGGICFRMVLYALGFTVFVFY